MDAVTFRTLCASGDRLEREITSSSATALAGRPGPAVWAAWLAAYLAADLVLRPLIALPSGVLPWYPAAGIAIAFIVRIGPAAVPAVFLARLALMCWPSPGEPFGAMVLDAGVIVGLQGLAALWLRRHVRGVTLLLVRDCAICIAVLLGAALLGGLVGGAIATLRAGPGGEPAWVNVIGFALGDATGMLLLVPALVLAPKLLGRDRRRSWRRNRVLELAALGALACGVVALDAVLSRHGTSLGRYLWFLPLVWAALSEGLRGAAAMGVFFAVVITAFSALGLLTEPMVLQTQALLLTLAIAGLLVATASASAAESDARYWHVLAAADEGIWRLSPRGRIVYVNDRMARLLGKDADALVGAAAVDFVAPEHRERWLEEQARASAASTTFEVELVQPGGPRRQVLMTLSPAWSPAARQMVGAVGLVTDVSRLRAEEARRKVVDQQRDRAETLLETIFRSSADAMILFRARDELIIDVNDAWCRTTGFRREDVIGHPQRELGIWDDLRDSGRLAAITEEHGEVSEFEFGFQRRLPDGETERGIAVLSARSATIAGERYLLCIGRDVTLERRAQQQRAQDQRLEDLGRLASGIAHDFNNMLAVIGFYGDILKRDAADGRAADAEATGELSKAVERGHALTRRLLSFSRSRGTPVDAIDLNGAVLGFSGILKPVLGDRISQRFELGEEVPPIVADATEVGQILLNLATNARDAMPEGGTLTVRTRALHAPVGEVARLVGPDVEPGEYAVLEVQDTGSGMDESTRLRAFEPFFTTKAEGKGTGLGLSVVHGILRRAHGAVRVDSAPGRGTCFRLFWPRARAAVTHAQERAAVLVVTDDEALGRRVRHPLEEDGLEVRQAADTQSGLHEARQGADLVICDATGRLDGWMLARALATERPHLPVVVLAPEDGASQSPAALPNVKRVVRVKDLGALVAIARASLGGLSSRADGELAAREGPA